jgi:hypothetical protein
MGFLVIVHIKLSIWFSGQFFQHLMREGSIFFFFEKLTPGWTIAYFSATLLVTTSSFLAVKLTMRHRLNRCVRA